MTNADISADFPFASRFVEVMGSRIHYVEEGLVALQALGQVTHIVKLGGYHLGAQNGLDDPLYVRRYGATLWALAGVDHKGGLKPDHILQVGGEMPAPGLSLFTYETSTLPEGMFLLEREDGIQITADSLQNWTKPGSLNLPISALSGCAFACRTCKSSTGWQHYTSGTFCHPTAHRFWAAPKKCC